MSNDSLEGPLITNWNELAREANYGSVSNPAGKNSSTIPYRNQVGFPNIEYDPETFVGPPHLQNYDKGAFVGPPYVGFFQRGKSIGEPSSKITPSESVTNRGSASSGYTSDPNFYYSFSGADCDVYAFRGGRGSLVHLDSIATVSVSIYEAKAPVRALGHASPVGFSGNIRSIAGSIICILQDKHPLSKLMEKRYDKHLDDVINRKVAGRIFPFNLMLMYKNEVGNGLSMQIDNIEIISEGIVTSVNDLATEMVFQFVATEMHQLKITSTDIVKNSKRG